MEGQLEMSLETKARMVKGGFAAEMKEREQGLSNINKKQEKVEAKVKTKRIKVQDVVYNQPLDGGKVQW